MVYLGVLFIIYLPVRKQNVNKKYVLFPVRKQKTIEISQVTVHVQAKIQSKVAMTTGLITLGLLVTTVLALGLRTFPAFHTHMHFLISGTLFLSNSLINPLLYCYRDRRFRSAVLQSLVLIIEFQIRFCTSGHSFLF